MKIHNGTKFSIATALKEAVVQYPTSDLTVELKYCPKGSRRYVSGTYYRKTRNYENGKLIRVRINRHNRYPVKIHFKTSDYYTKTNSRGEQIIYQKFKTVQMKCPEDLILAIFLHEFSHYLDHIEGRNGRYKQTKADRFALAILKQLEVV